MLTTENSKFTLYCLLWIFKINEKRVIDAIWKYMELSNILK